MRYKVLSAVSVTRTGAFFSAGSEIELDNQVNEKEVKFLLGKKVIEELNPEPKPEPKTEPKPKASPKKPAQPKKGK